MGLDRSVEEPPEWAGDGAVVLLAGDACVIDEVEGLLAVGSLANWAGGSMVMDLVGSANMVTMSFSGARENSIRSMRSCSLMGSPVPLGGDECCADAGDR